MQNAGKRKVSSWITCQSAALTPDDFIRINVSGMYYDVLKSTLEQFPDTLLGMRLVKHLTVGYVYKTGTLVSTKNR